MKKHKLLFLALVAIILLSGCKNTYHVISKSTFDKTINEIKSDIAKQGYALSGISTDSKNNVYVAGTSYSTSAGYGSKMANDMVTTDTYRFTHDDGSTMSFSVSYKAMQDAPGSLIYVTEVFVPGCEVSNPQLYDTLCGSNSPVNKIYAMPQDTSFQKTNAGGTLLLLTFLALIMGGLSFFIYSAMQL